MKINKKLLNAFSVITLVTTAGLLAEVYNAPSVSSYNQKFAYLVFSFFAFSGIAVYGLFFKKEKQVRYFIKRQAPKKDEVKTKNIPEKQKIAGAIRTDLVLSIEIILIAKQSISGSLLLQISTLSLVGVAASIIIYGLVALLVKIDDFGLYLVKKGRKKIGLNLVKSMPYIMKSLTVIGTIAMLLVGGGIIDHTFHFKHIMPELLQQLLLALLAGFILVGVIELFSKLLNRKS